MKRTSYVIALSMLAFIAGPAWAADPAPAERGMTHGKVTAATTFRSSKLMGMTVKNPQGEKLGTIEDIVTDVQGGKITYLALAHGGALGIGEKLFAVPYAEFKFMHDKDEQYFVLDIPKDKLAAAPGFEKNKWPDFADQNWRMQVDQYYREATQRDRGTETPTRK